MIKNWTLVGRVVFNYCTQFHFLLLLFKSALHQGDKWLFILFSKNINKEKNVMFKNWGPKKFVLVRCSLMYCMQKEGTVYTYSTMYIYIFKTNKFIFKVLWFLKKWKLCSINALDAAKFALLLELNSLKHMYLIGSYVSNFENRKKVQITIKQIKKTIV